LALNSNPPDLCLLSSKDYRCELLAPSNNLDKIYGHATIGMGTCTHYWLFITSCYWEQSIVSGGNERFLLNFFNDPQQTLLP
jgi:hypothetical protein